MSNESPRPRKKAPPRVQPPGASSVGDHASSVSDLVAALGDLGRGGGEESTVSASEDGEAGVSSGATGSSSESPVGEGDGSSEGAAPASKTPRDKGRARRKKGADAEHVAAEGDASADTSDPETSDETSGESAPVAGGGDASAADGEASEASSDDGEAKPSRPGVQLVDALPMDDDDDLSKVEGEASARLTMIVESLLFASSKALSVKELRRVLGDPTTRQIQLALKQLIEDSQSRGVVCQQVAGGFVLRTHPDNASWVQRLLQAKPVRLSRPQLETLAVVAYRQPITRPEIDLVRGVDSGATLKVLLERELVQIVGRKEEPGRPLLYGTTIKFLEFFNLTSLRDLPDLREFKELSSEAKAQLRRDMSDDEIEALGQEVMAFARPEGEEPSDAAVDGEDAGEGEGEGAAAEGEGAAPEGETTEGEDAAAEGTEGGEHTDGEPATRDADEGDGEAFGEGDGIADAPASDEAEAPSDEAEAPSDEAEAPSDEAEGPSDEAEAPSDEAEAPSDEAEAPSDEAEAPSDEAEGPSESTQGEVTDDGDVPADPASSDDPHAAEPEADEAP